MSRPRVLVTLDTGETVRRGVPLPQLSTKPAYLDAVWAAGGAPWPVHPPEDPARLQDMLTDSQALLVTGGDFDIPPTAYGQRARPGAQRQEKPARTAFEAQLITAALADGRPILGVCGGMQLLNVVCGGSLLQDIRQALPQALDHEQPTDPRGPDHGLQLNPQSPLPAWLGPVPQVNSTHHQAVDRVGEGLEVWARAPDGVIEAIGRPGPGFVCGVQWHPELLPDRGQAIYRPFLAAAGAPQQG